ncbi:MULTISPECIES: thioredoxin [Culturomica]|jgi:thioredoxin 1|uniref:thioredoxin n=1 Tax=Culturomica TaxID=1926651 RepID=UPI00033A82B1|nr:MULTISPECIES: thioredoxin [Odoribacteraceae]RHV98638.1 thioredoxin [Odoribacter sp. OF09-27XD]CCZ06649.1 thioredoxin [Odoribacter sp. CAG:788]HBO25858.1 thioredoxin [Culturomica sp.]
MEKFEELISSEVPVLVDYYATWCGPCKMMHPVLEDLKARLGDKVKIVKLDVDVPANRQSVYTYQIQSVPTLMLFRKGQMLWRQSGVVRLNELQGIVEKYINN